MRESLPARESERPILLPKGWLEFSLEYDRKIGLGAWGPNGERNLFEHARWVDQVGRVGLRYGLSPRWELSIDLPYHFASITNDHLGTEIRDNGLGDPRLGARYELLQGATPDAQLVAEVVYKAPAGQEAPGTFIGGPNNVNAFVFTTGTPDLSMGVAGKKAFGPVFLTGGAGYVRRFSAIVQYLVETENSQFLGRIRPGDQGYGNLGVGVQAGPLALSGGARAVYRGETRTGTTSPGANPSKNLDPVVGSDGFALDATAELVVNFSRGFDLSANATFPLMGEDLQFFPIEDLQPTLGPTFGGAVEIRY